MSRDVFIEHLRSAGAITATCVGTSMEPTLTRGERMRIVAGTDSRLGDVVVFLPRERKEPVAHRVLLRAGGWILHAGDRDLARAGLARTSQIIGRADLPRLSPPRLAARVAGAVLRRLGMMLYSREWPPSPRSLAPATTRR